MKKRICITLSLVLLLTLSACNEKKTAVSPTEEASDELSSTEKQEQDISVDTCVEDITFESLEEYEKEFPGFQKKWFRPQVEHLADFVTYDMIEEYGSFCFLAVSIFSERPYYYYSLMDNNGYKFFLIISVAPRIALDLSALSTVENSEDLRISAATEGVYNIENLEYVYKEGELREIHWTTQNRAFKLMPDDDSLANYTGEKPSLINSLLNTETAPAAIAEFNRKVSD